VLNVTQQLQGGCIRRTFGFGTNSQISFPTLNRAWSKQSRGDQKSMGMPCGDIKSVPRILVTPIGRQHDNGRWGFETAIQIGTFHIQHVHFVNKQYSGTSSATPDQCTW
jgi:hypothetical protein